MATCTSCGHDVTGKKFCPECGTPVQAAPVAAVPPTSTTTCPRCNGTVRLGAGFCMHCGSSLSAQAVSSTATPSQPLTRQCIACHSEVPVGSAFCTNCGQSVQAASPATPAPSQSIAYCTSCGFQNRPDVRFCGNCGQPLVPTAGTQMPQTQYPQQPYAQQQYVQAGQQPYGQPAYAQPQYNTQYPPQQPYQQPMMGQQPMVLRCPVCMAMSPVGATNCPSCRTSLAGIVPTPSAMPAQGQQQGGLGGFMQGSGGSMAMGALGGAAAVLGGEMLMHDLERGHRRERYDGDDRGDGLLGGLGDLANDIGLF